MKKVNKLIISLLLLSPLYTNVYAAPTEEGKSSIVSATEDNKYTAAIIKKIDKENGKINLQHEEVKNLGMPAMNMAYKLKLTDMSSVDTLNVGDKVKTFLDKTSDGFVVREIIKIQ